MTETEKTVQKAPLIVATGLVADEARAGFLTQKTPRDAIQKRKGRGGQTFNYIKGEYVIEVLNKVFGLTWDFEVTPIKSGELFLLQGRQVLVAGKLTIYDKDGKPRIIKSGIGKKDIAYEKTAPGANASTIPMDLGNDVKAAETDALKRCARMLGIGLDLYKDEAHYTPKPLPSLPNNPGFNDRI